MGITGVAAVTCGTAGAGGRDDRARAGSGGGFDGAFCTGGAASPDGGSKRCVSGSGSRSVAGGGTDAMRVRIAGGGGTGCACDAVRPSFPVSTACPFASRSPAPINVDFTDASGMVCVMYGSCASAADFDAARAFACGGGACGGEAPGGGGGRDDFICGELPG